MQNEALKAELVNTVKSQADLLAMGKRLGFEFDAADLASRELTDEELKMVAGGTLGLAGGPTIGSKGWTPVGSFEKWSPVSAFDTFVSQFGKH